MATTGEWQELLGSYLHTGNDDDIYAYGGNNFNGRVGGAPQPPSGYGRGLRGVLSDDKKMLSVQIDTLAVGVRVATGQAFASWYAGRGTIYNWVIRYWHTTVATENPSSIPESNWTNPQEQHVVTRYGQDRLYWSNGWTTTGTVNTTVNLYTAPFPIDVQWLRFELRGNTQATLPIYAYIKFSTLIPEFRPMAIMQNNEFYSLNNEGGFLKIMKSGQWKDIALMNDGEVGTQSGSNRIVRNGVFVGQSKIGEDK